MLFYGIIGALVFRAIFIALGSVLMQYTLVVLVFGAFLILTGVKMLRAPEHKVDPERNALIRLFRRWVPVTPEFHGPRFLVRLNGRWHATPLLVALLFLEMSDIIFAVDSVPAIFAISREPFIVFTSNVFAILGLRAMYFLLAGAIERFHLLKYALALILIFVGLSLNSLEKVIGKQSMILGRIPGGYLRSGSGCENHGIRILQDTIVGPDPHDRGLWSQGSSIRTSTKACIDDDC